jgi:hypothetical protein
MNRNALVLLSALLLLSVSSAAFAVGPDPLEGTADCDGWAFGGTMYFGTWDYMPYDFIVALYQGETLVCEYYQEGTLYLSDGMSFSFNGSWCADICGDYNMVIKFWWYGIYGPGEKNIEYTFTCDCTAEGCTYTPGFWKNHEEDWPVDALRVGCVDYTKAELLDIFDWPTRGDMTIKLFHHLVAAKLNVLSGAPDYIMGSITAGDDFLYTIPLGSKPSGMAKNEAEDIKDALADYNEIPCYDDTLDIMLSIEGPAVDKAAAATEESSWGSIKKKHQ